MLTVVVVLDHEEGHTLPTLRIARKLKANGHRVVYVGLPDAGRLVADEAFDFVEIMSDRFPPGWVGDFRRLSRSNGSVVLSMMRDRYLEPIARGGALDALMDRLKPDVVITNALCSIE